MQIYINNLNLDIINDISELFKEYLYNSEMYTQLFTDDGIYHIDDQIYLLETFDNDIKIYNKYYNNFSLIVDPSFFKKQKVNSVLGNTHISFQIIKQYYRLSKISKIKLVIEYYLDNGKKPFNIYFISTENNDINDFFIKEEIIEFLSVLK